MKNIIATLFVILSLTITATITACAPVTANRGNLLEDYQMQEVKPGLDTRDDVIRKIGSPTTTSPFDNNIWYYMGQQTEKRGILDTKVINERIVMVTFGADGLVDSVKERKEGREDVPVVKRETKTSGNEMTILQQMLGNLGKFNKPAGSATDTAGGH